MANLLSAKAVSRLSNHDFYEFNWGGFGLNICGPLVVGILPIKSVHQFAFFNLQTAQLLIWMKGYDDMNVISHSWGTCLAYDMLNSGGIEMHDWVTMGSPLNHDISKPIWNEGLWINAYASEDRVVHFDMYPVPFYFPRYDSGITDDQQVDLQVPITGGHSAYWTDMDLIETLRDKLQ